MSRKSFPISTENSESSNHSEKNGALTSSESDIFPFSEATTQRISTTDIKTESDEQDLIARMPRRRRIRGKIVNG